jgi:malonyl-CoA/methylmalonyl-CoA synthetase
MPEKTAEELRSDGWFITGDLGCLDDDAYLTIVGRSKDLIISGGYNVYPKEVELVIDEHASVLESAVIGVPHADFGEAVVAIVVAKGEDNDEAGIRALCSASLAAYKRPKSILFVDELPRNTMGKVQKAKLRTEYSSALTQR